YIEDPGYYFESADSKTDSHLDLLMMTQGWRRYDCDSIMNDSLQEFKFPMEQTQSISGSVEKVFNRLPKGMQIALFSPTTLEMTQFPLGDNNRFVISGLDFTDGSPFTLEAQSKDGDAGRTAIHIDEPVMPKISPLKSVGLAYRQESDKDENAFVEHVRKQPRAVSLLDFQELDEVTVTARKPNKWSNRGNFEPFRGYQSGDEKISHFPTMESMLRSLTVKIRYSEAGGALPEPTIGEYVNGDFMPMPVFIDGFISEQREAFDLNPQNVNSIEYFRPGDARIASYTQTSVYTGVLLITTKYGNEGGRTPLPSTVNITPLGYQPPVEFYAPRYDANDNTPPPYRATIYWNPKLQLNPSGKTLIDLEGIRPGQPVNVTLQGIASDGKIIDITKKVQLQ
ncbi:MAG: hypothetical protein HDS29_06265, partial [Bacteroides sp.]|nr:hypothetical protein [Bacteroides sp.]